MSIKYCQTNNFYQAGAGSIIGATTVVLTSFTDIYGNVLTMTDFGDIGYGTLEPDTSNEEGFTFTGVTANVGGTYTLTGVKTILAVSPYTATSGLIRQHAGGTKVVITDNVAFWDSFPNKNNDETIEGQWTFNHTPIIPGINDDASTTVKGVTKLSVAPDVASNPIAVGTNDIRVPVGYAVDSVGTDSYAITPGTAIAAYVAGQVFVFKAGTANTGACTLDVSGLGPVDIKKNVSETLVTGDILANQIVTVVFDGTNMQMVSSNPSATPVVRVYKYTSVGATSTRFDISNPVGTTFRYTYDGTGTNPGITAATFPVGAQVSIWSTAMTVANTGYYVVTGSGANYFEVTNAAGFAENDKLLTGGFLLVNKDILWSKPTGLKYVIIEVQGGGGAGGGSTTANQASGGGGGGGYAKKLVAVGTLGATETVTVGAGGKSGASSGGTGGTGGTSSFGAHASCAGGVGGAELETGGAGGVASSGDLNIDGGDGGNAPKWYTGAATNYYGGGGGDAVLATTSKSNTGTTGSVGKFYGGGGTGAGNNGGTDTYGGHGAAGIIIVTEFY